MKFAAVELRDSDMYQSSPAERWYFACQTRKAGMMRSTVIAAAIMMAPMATAAQTNVCLQLNRVFSTEVIDSQTLQATDLQHRPYTIHMLQKCVGLDKFAQNLSFRRGAKIGSEYLCLQHGDTLGYSLPGNPSMAARSITIHGAQSQMQCTVDSVTPGPAKPGAK
jgi:hypothetical protein